MRPTHLISADNIVAYTRAVLDQAKTVAFPYKTRVDLPGLRITARHGGGTLPDALERCFVTSSDQLHPVESMDVAIAHPGIAGMAPPVSWGGGHFYPQQIDDILDIAGLEASFFYDLNHWHLYNRAQRDAVQLMRAPDAYPPWEVGAPLRVFLHWYYAGRGMRLGHSGTLGINGVGVLLAGAGGSGKSGTVIGGVINGLDSVGDDYVLLDAQSDMTAYPLYATLKQDPQGFERLGLQRILPAQSPLNWQGKHTFLLQDIAARPVPPKLAIKALLVPQVARLAKSRISPMSRREAMLALAASSIYQMPGERGSGFRFFSKVTNMLPCFSFELGVDPREVTDTVADFIEGRSA